MNCREALLCRNFVCLRVSTLFLIIVNFIGSLSGAVLSPFIFTSVSSQIKDYYREEHGYISDEFYAELNYLWSLLVLAELAFVGNIIFLIPLTTAVKNKCKVIFCLVLLDADIFYHFWIFLWCS